MAKEFFGTSSEEESDSETLPSSVTSSEDGSGLLDESEVKIEISEIGSKPKESDLKKGKLGCQEGPKCKEQGATIVSLTQECHEEEIGDNFEGHKLDEIDGLNGLKPIKVKSSKLNGVQFGTDSQRIASVMGSHEKTK